MRRQAGQLLLALACMAAIAGPALAQPAGGTRLCPCPRLYAPVCAGGKQYPNPCEARCQGFTAFSPVPATGGCAASATPAARPASANGTAAAPPSNGMASANGTAAKAPGARPVCACALLLAPVCGSDGKVYSNKCVAECQGATVTGPAPTQQDAACPAVSSTGAQPQPQVVPPGPSSSQPRPQVVPPRQGQQQPARPACACALLLAPVCGSDGNVHPNKCVAECEGVQVLGPAPLEEGAHCPSPATNQPRPQVVRPGPRTSQPRPQVVPPGPGQQQPARPVCICNLLLAPVCGSDGKVHPNKCVAECEGVQVLGPAPLEGVAQCPSPATSQPRPQVVPPGRGQQPTGQPRPQVVPAGPVCRCPRIYLPVCTANGGWFANACLADCAGFKAADVRECPSAAPRMAGRIG